MSWTQTVTGALSMTFSGRASTDLIVFEITLKTLTPKVMNAPRNRRIGSQASCMDFGTRGSEQILHSRCVSRRSRGDHETSTGRTPPCWGPQLQLRRKSPGTSRCTRFCSANHIFRSCVVVHIPHRLLANRQLPRCLVIPADSTLDQLNHPDPDRLLNRAGAVDCRA